MAFFRQQCSRTTLHRAFPHHYQLSVGKCTICLRNLKLWWFPLRMTDFDLGSLVSSTWCFVGPSERGTKFVNCSQVYSAPSRISSSFNLFFTSLSTNITP